MDPETHIHVGTAGFVRPPARYREKLSFVEIEPRPPLPNPKVLGSWRTEVGNEFAFALVSPPTLWGEKDWPLRDEKSVKTELEKFTAFARSLAPRVIVFRTPAAIRPGSAALKRFFELVEKTKRLAKISVWEPAGVWERDAAVEAAKGTGLVVASDPLRDDVEGEPVVYARMRGLGSDRRYHVGRLEDLAEAIESAEEAYVVFDTDGAFKEATQLVALLQGVALEAEETIDDDEDEDEEPDGDEDEEFDEEDGGLDEDDEDEV